MLSGAPPKLGIAENTFDDETYRELAKRFSAGVFDLTAVVAAFGKETEKILPQSVPL